jgi:hypothetical protein
MAVHGAPCESFNTIVNSTPVAFVELPAELRSYLTAEKDIGKFLSLKDIV